MAAWGLWCAGKERTRRSPLRNLGGYAGWKVRVLSGSGLSALAMRLLQGSHRVSQVVCWRPLPVQIHSTWYMAWRPRERPQSSQRRLERYRNVLTGVSFCEVGDVKRYRGATPPASFVGAPHSLTPPGYEETSGGVYGSKGVFLAGQELERTTRSSSSRLLAATLDVKLIVDGRNRHGRCDTQVVAGDD